MKIPLLLFAFSIIFLIGCQKEVDVNTPARVLNDSTRLAMFVELDTTEPSGLDTLYKVSFTYDTDGRLTYWRYDEPTFPDYQERKFFYFGNDTLPSKFVDLYDGSNGDTYADTIFLWYSNGLVSRDSMVSYNLTTNTLLDIMSESYTVNGNNIFLKARLYDTGPIPSYQWSGTIFRTLQNGNIIKQIDTTTSSISFTGYSQIDATYDNKINPLYKMTPPYPLIGQQVIQRNNTLESKHYGGGTTHEIDSYIYRADGYPLSIIRMDINGGLPEFLSKGYYIYTR